jgi:hypothetical protein
MNLKNLLHKLGSTSIFFYSLIWLLVILVIGTIDQRSLGLHEAQEKYFSAWITFFGPVPTPGGRLVMTVMTLNLTFLLLDFSAWSWRKSGILIAHFGSLLLLVGGFITALTSVEGSLSLPEEATGSEFIDYNELQLVFIDHSPKDHDNIYAFYGKSFESGQTLVNSTLGEGLSVEFFYANSEFVTRDNPTNDIGMMSRFELKSLPNEKESTHNLPGMMIKQKVPGQPDKLVMVQEAMSINPSLVIKGLNYKIVLERRRHRLPFQIKLVDFVRELHPGTETPRSYHSDIILIDNNAPREVRIQMNEPLRHRGYTFFQSSFSQSRSGETSVFAVVKNSGRNFPYISSLVICFGLLIHMILRLPARLKRTAVMENGGLT